MRMMDELKPLFLYSSNKRVFAPVDEKDKRKGAAILLLTKDPATSAKLMQLPYIHNPNLFLSYYIDRNVMAYIDSIGEKNIEFDEKEAEALSEGIIFSSLGNIKFKFADGTSTMDQKRVLEVFNRGEVSKHASILKIRKLPDSVKVKVYPNLSNLRSAAPRSIQSTRGNNLYSFVSDDTIHIIGYISYDQDIMGGPYNIFLRTELIQYMIQSFNDSIHDIPARGIAMALSGQLHWIESNPDSSKYYTSSDEFKFAKVVNRAIQTRGHDIIAQYVASGNINLLKNFAITNVLSNIKRVLFESELSYMEKQRLLPSEFGIPDKRKYPIHDEDHVRAAVRMFNNCDPEDEAELAANIISKMKKFGIYDMKISAANRFKKYYTPDWAKEKKDDKKAKHESVMLEGSFENSDYADILRICSHLSPNEFRRISFYDTYRDSPFVAKRIIKRIGMEPAGFLDVYVFPSHPDIAQIVIAVDSRFRGQHVADDLVNELMDSDLPKNHNFKMYYWTAHLDNEASQNLAVKHGFTYTGNIDKYGRKVFTKTVASESHNSIWSDVPDYMKPTKNFEDFVETVSTFGTEDMVLFTEAEGDQYSTRLKQYLYKERIKNNKEALELYDRIKSANPNIKKTYIKLDMYKKLNLFLDLSYYHGLFLKNNRLQLDRAVNFYFDFINRLINNKEISTEYKHQTIFIPIDLEAWGATDTSVLMDYRANLNPISIIIRLIRTNPEALRKAWGNKSVMFVGSRGYFIVDFSKLDSKNINRFKTNIEKLTSANRIIEDDEEIDELGDNPLNATKRARTADMLGHLEDKMSIKLDNIKPSVSIEPADIPHMTIQDGPISLDPKRVSAPNGIVVISVDDEEHKNLTNGVLSKVKGINTLCIPK